MPTRDAVQRIDPDARHWPELWNELPDPPEYVSSTGDSRLLQCRSLAIVGTRRASARGLAVAEGLAASLARAGWCIVSGLAQGIDAAAHRGALLAGGPTIAVMGTGLGHTFPVGHTRLRREIETAGCVISEFPENAGPRKYHFPKRNRLIAGLCEGTIVIEAPLKSGALITAFFALDMNREVMAVPGPVDQDNYRGSHHLLRQGATLVESLLDVHRVVIPPRTGAATPGNSRNTDGPDCNLLPTAGSSARWIWDRIDTGGVSRAELAGRWHGTGAAMAEGILALEMAGLIRRLPGGLLARKIWRP